MNVPQMYGNGSLADNFQCIFCTLISQSGTLGSSPVVYGSADLCLSVVSLLKVALNLHSKGLEIATPTSHFPKPLWLYLFCFYFLYFIHFPSLAG